MREVLPQAAPAWLVPPAQEQFGFAGPQNQRYTGQHHHQQQQETQDRWSKQAQ